MSCPRLGLVIAGAQKAGTSSLKHYLGQHPEIRMHPAGEFTFFVNEELHSNGYDAAFRQFFYESTGRETVIAGKSAGLLHDRNAIERLHEHNPDVRIVVLLRHPVDRAYSAYWYARRLGWEDAATFEEAIDREPDERTGDPVLDRNRAYLANGCYADQLCLLRDRFGAGAIKPIQFEWFRDDPRSICRDLFEWVSVAPDFVPDVRSRRNPASGARLHSLNRAIHGPSGLKRWARRWMPGRWIQGVKKTAVRMNRRPIERAALDPSLRIRLIEYYRPHNEKLAGETGWDLTSWQR